LGLARSDYVVERAFAGRQLARYAGDTEIDAALRVLLLDPRDTMVAQETAEGLLARRDAAGWRLFAAAYQEADDHTIGHLGDAMYSVRQTHEDQNSLVAGLRVVAKTDEDPIARAGAEEILHWLGEGPVIAGFVLTVAQTLPAAGDRHGVVVAVHNGVVHVGDRISEAQPPSGAAIAVDLEIIGLATNRSHPVDSMDRNHVGLAVVLGSVPDDLREGWTLAGDRP
jgi:hypothetical protein